MTSPLLQIKNLTKKFPIKSGFWGRDTQFVHAVTDVSFDLNKGEILGVVGESGCGKSTLGRTILKLIEPDYGRIFFKGQDITDYSAKDMQTLRRKMQIVFQDPFASLNPRMSIGKILEEPLVIHKLYKKHERKARVAELLEMVGLEADHAMRYPHQFSGGQRQRIGIARALALEPDLIIADEPVSALDVSIQAQIINLLSDLQKKLDLSLIFISHDIRVVKYLCDEVLVMYLGQVMEKIPAAELDQAIHPYTKSLLSAVPIPDPHRSHQRTILKGDVPSPINPPSACVFHPRCPEVMDQCYVVKPTLKKIKDHHDVNCFLV